MLLFDWKYAVPLAFVSPASYLGVATMHVVNDGFHIGGQYRKHAKPASGDRGTLLEWSNGRQPLQPVQTSLGGEE